MVEHIHTHSILRRILGLGISFVEDSCDFCLVDALLMSPMVDQIIWNPALVDDDSTLLVLFIQVGVEGNDDIIALFAHVLFLNSHLSAVIEHAVEFDGLHGVVCLKFGCILACPWKLFVFFGSEQDRFLDQ